MVCHHWFVLEAPLPLTASTRFGFVQLENASRAGCAVAHGARSIAHTAASTGAAPLRVLSQFSGLLSVRGFLATRCSVTLMFWLGFGVGLVVHSIE